MGKGGQGLFIHMSFHLIFLMFGMSNNMEFLKIVCSGTFRVVGFEVQPLSIDYNELKFNGDSCVLPSDRQQDIKGQEVDSSGGPLKLHFTYSVKWVLSPVSWASRWDIYLAMSDVQIHWFSILNSLIVIFFLSGLYLHTKIS